MLLLIDTREPPPEPDPDESDGRRRPRITLSELRPAINLVIGLALALAAADFPPPAAFILLAGACIEFGRALNGIGGSPTGMREHRQ